MEYNGLKVQQHQPIEPYELTEVIEGLVCTADGFTGSDASDDASAVMFQKLEGRLTSGKLIDLMHESDECCEVRLTFLDGKLMSLHKFVGDRSSYIDGFQIIDGELAKELYLMYLAEITNTKVKNLIDGAVPFSNSLIYDQNQYIDEVGNGWFLVGSPRFSWFKNLFPDHVAVHINRDGELLRVSNFLSWADGNWYSRNTAGTFDTESGPMDLDAASIYFSMNNSPDHEFLAQVAVKVAETNQWSCSIHKATKTAVTISQHVKGRFCQSPGSIVMRTEADAIAFVERYSGVNKGTIGALSNAIVELGNKVDRMYFSYRQ